jgi:hypothetical protein
MLPDFYTIKTGLQKRVEKVIRRIINRESGFIGEIARTRVFEGDRNKIIASDGVVIQDNAFHEEAVSFQVESALIDNISPEDVRDRLIDSAKKMARAQKKHFYESMNKLIDEAGTSLDAKGAKFSIELWLEGLDKIDIDFNPDNTPRWPTLIMHPKMRELAQEEFQRLETDPSIKEKYEETLRKKRDEWIARENNRKLVG